MYKQGEIILTRFPYSNFEQFKIRPALVLSTQTIHKFNDIIILGITSQKLDDTKFEVEITNQDLLKGSLPKKSFIRISKITTLEKSLILKKVAFISKNKQNEVLEKISKMLSREL